jgi:hypothetical protein
MPTVANPKRKKCWLNWTNCWQPQNLGKGDKPTPIAFIDECSLTECWNIPLAIPPFDHMGKVEEEEEKQAGNELGQAQALVG